jgi:hypothetical protein
MGKACKMHGEEMNAYRILVGKPGRKRPLGRSTHRTHKMGCLGLD